MVRNKKVTREFVYSATKEGIPLDQLHEHLQDFLMESYVQTKTINTIKNYRAYLKRWIRWVYLSENIPLPDSIKPVEKKQEKKLEPEVKYEYTVPEPIVEPDKEYLDFLKRYEEVDKI